MNIIQQTLKILTEGNDIELSGVVKELFDKIKSGTHRLVSSVDGSLATLERKNPKTNEWLIGTKVRKDVAKKLIKHLKGKQIGGEGSAIKIYTT